MKRVHVLFVLGCETDETHCHDCGHVQWHGIDDEGRDGEPWCGDTSLSLDNCLDMDEHGAPLRADLCRAASSAFDDAIRGAKAEGLRACLAIAKERAEVGFFPPDAQRESIDWTQVAKEVEALCRD